MHLPFLHVNINTYQTKFAVNCHHFVLFHKYNKYEFIFRKRHHFSRGNIKAVLNLTSCIEHLIAISLRKVIKHNPLHEVCT